MSIAEQIASLKEKVSDCYDAVDEKGGELPSVLNSENLPDAILSITGGGTPWDGSYHIEGL